MASDDAQKPLQTFPSCLYNFIRESVGENLAWKRRDVHSSGLMLENVTESFEIRVAPANNRVAKLKGGNIGLLSA
jgi:hypothetical protein